MTATASTATPLAPIPPALRRLIELRPHLRGRVQGMYRGARKSGRGSEQSAIDWVLKTLRDEAEKVVELGPSQRTEYRNDRQYARDKEGARNRDAAYSEALGLIGSIDRAKLENPS